MTDADKRSILIIEDDELFAGSLQRFLEKRDMRVEVERRGDGAIEHVHDFKPDAVVLDCNLPGKDGFAICRELRSSYQGVILMLTALDEDQDHLLGLGLGADDYLGKPATPELVLAHLRACWRRNGANGSAGQASGSSEEIRFGRFYISSATRVVRLDSQEVPFSTAEFDLLWLLASKAGIVLSRDDINTALRGIEHDVLDRSIDMRISRLRKALGDDAENPVRIKTVRGKGYLFSRTDWT